MPNESSEPVQVEFTPEFKRNLRALFKKYRHIRSDVQPVIDQLQAGEVMGDQVPGTHYTIFKQAVPKLSHIIQFSYILSQSGNFQL